MSNLYSFLLLPHNYIAEEILIGSIIINSNLILFIIKKIDVNHFFIESHKIIYRNLITIHKDNHIDPVELAYSLKKTKLLNHIGGIKTITKLIKHGQVFNSSNNIHFYIQEVIKIIYHNHHRRLIVQYGYNMITLAQNYELSNTILTNKASQYLSYLSLLNDSKNLDNLQELIGSLIRSLKDVHNESSYKNTVLYSGFKNLDILTNGLPKGDLIVIAGRPSMGKTSLVMNIAYHVIAYFQTQTCIFSLEMTKTQILHKLISIGSKISVQDIIDNKLNTKNWIRIQKVCNEILSAKIYINDNANISIDEIQYIVEIITRNSTSSQIIIIDYLQLINNKSLSIDNRTQEISYITRKLKILAQNSQVPIIVLSQLNRSIEKRTNKQPLLSDLKESGCVNIGMLVKHNNMTNSTHIKTIHQKTHQISTFFFSNKNFNRYSNNTKKIYTFYSYIFQCIFKCNKIIHLTHNHSYLSSIQWLKTNQLQENIIVHQIYLGKYYLYPKKMEQTYIKKNIWGAFNKVYDIQKQTYCHFISDNTILHNSIEQDADIIMMLYNSIALNNNSYLPKLKLLDILICKNRNGPIGEFKLYFNSINTIFTDAPHNDHLKENNS